MPSFLPSVLPPNMDTEWLPRSKAPVVKDSGGADFRQTLERQQRPGRGESPRDESVASRERSETPVKPRGDEGEGEKNARADREAAPGVKQERARSGTSEASVSETPAGTATPMANERDSAAVVSAETGETPPHADEGDAPAQPSEHLAPLTIPSSVVTSASMPQVSSPESLVAAGVGWALSAAEPLATGEGEGLRLAIPPLLSGEPMPALHGETSVAPALTGLANPASPALLPASGLPAAAKPLATVALSSSLTNPMPLDVDAGPVPTEGENSTLALIADVELGEDLKANAAPEPRSGKPADGPAGLLASFNFSAERAFALRGEGLPADGQRGLTLGSIETLLSEGSGKAAPVSGMQQQALNLSHTLDGRQQMPVQIRFGQPGWAELVAERSAMIVSQNLKFAELQLDPPELGPLQVRVSVQHDQAAVHFVAANAQVREALDQTLARLRDLLSEQGMDLVDVDVSDHQSQASHEDGTSGRGGKAAVNDEAQPAGDEGPVTHTVQARYGIDSYA